MIRRGRRRICPPAARAAGGPVLTEQSGRPGTTTPPPGGVSPPRCIGWAARPYNLPVEYDYVPHHSRAGRSTPCTTGLGPPSGLTGHVGHPFVFRGRPGARAPIPYRPSPGRRHVDAPTLASESSSSMTRATRSRRSRVIAPVAPDLEQSDRFIDVGSSVIPLEVLLAGQVPGRSVLGWPESTPLRSFN